MGAISVERAEPGVAVVSLSGEHAAWSAPKLELEFALLQFDRYSIVVDLSETRALDAAIVEVLLRARENAIESRRKFALVVDESTDESVLRLFETMGLRNTFPVGATPRAALEAA